MDRKATPKKGSKLRGRLIGLACIAVAVGLAMPLAPEILRQVKFLMGGHRGPASTGGAGGAIDQAMRTFDQAYEQTLGTATEKFKAIQQAEARNTWLALENANLKIELEKYKYGCSEKTNLKQTKKATLTLSKEAGSRVGRTLASIDFTPPMNLQPAQLYILALSYMKGKEDEKAAYLLTNLTGLEDIQTFKTAQNYLLTGALWFRLKNFKLAEDYMDLVLKLPENKESLAYQARARLWKALLARKNAKEAKVQYWLTELVDHHPHSMEAEWVNAGSGHKEAGRVPASKH